MRRGEVRIGIGNRYLAAYGYGVGVGASDRLCLGLGFGVGTGLGVGFRLGMAVRCGPHRALVGRLAMRAGLLRPWHVPAALRVRRGVCPDEGIAPPPAPRAFAHTLIHGAIHAE